MEVWTQNCPAEALIEIEEDEAFITTWTGQDVVIPINRSFTYNYSVDWDNDGIVDETGITGEASFSYPTTGPHTIQIVGEFPAVNFGSLSTGDPLAIVGLEQWGAGEWLSMASAFRGCENLIVNATDVPGFSNVTNMDSMFFDALLANPDVSQWDVSNVTNLRSMFSGTGLANPDVSDWDVSSITDMSFMFNRVVLANPDVSDWDVSSVTDMRGVFGSAEIANPDVSRWDVSNVTDMAGMFQFADSANPDVSNWDVSNVIDMAGMFSSAISADPDVSLWDVSNVRNMTGMFINIVSNPDISNWNTTNVTTMDFMFSNAISADPDISGWNVSGVTTMQTMFRNSGITNPDFSNWDVSNVTTMEDMFTGVMLSTEVYDQVLEDLSTKTRNNDVEFDGGLSMYCNETARNALEATGWIIDDGGTDPSCP